ncbi:unnamed protein product, partial [Effrenium voratum]
MTKNSEKIKPEYFHLSSTPWDEMQDAQDIEEISDVEGAAARSKSPSRRVSKDKLKERVKVRRNPKEQKGSSSTSSSANAAMDAAAEVAKQMMQEQQEQIAQKAPVEDDEEVDEVEELGFSDDLTINTIKALADKWRAFKWKQWLLMEGITK